MAKKKRKHTKTIVLVIVLILVTYFSVTFINDWSTLKRLQDNKVQMTDELVSIEDENSKIKEGIVFSNTKAFIERMAREIFGMVRVDEGEKKYVDENEGG